MVQSSRAFSTRRLQGLKELNLIYKTIADPLAPPSASGGLAQWIGNGMIGL